MNEDKDQAQDELLTPLDQRASIPFQHIKNEQFSSDDDDGGDDPPRWRRRRTLVNSSHQLRFTTVLLLQMTSVLIAIAAFSFIESQRAMSLVLQHTSAHPLLSHRLHTSNQSFLMKVLLVVGMAAVVQVLFGIFMSHKLAGPIVKMSQVLDRIGRGDYDGDVHFRQGDQLEDVAETLNSLLTNLRHERSQQTTGLDAIETLLARAHAGETGADEELRRSLTQLAGVESAAAVPAAAGQEVTHG